MESCFDSFFLQLNELKECLETTPLNTLRVEAWCYGYGFQSDAFVFETEDDLILCFKGASSHFYGLNNKIFYIYEWERLSNMCRLNLLTLQRREND